MIENGHAWDIALTKYLNKQYKATAKKPSVPPAKSHALSEREKAICDRLFNDYLRRKKSSEVDEQIIEKKETKNVIIDPLRQYEIRNLHIDESEALNNELKKLRIAKQERDSVLNFSGIRKNAIAKISDELTEVYDSLSLIGDAALNANAINVLLAHHKKNQLTSLIEKIDDKVTAQEQIHSQTSYILSFEKNEIDLLKQKIILIIKSEAEKVLKMEGLEHLAVDGEDNLPLWTKENSINEDLINIINTRLHDKILYEDLLWYRRGIKSYIDRLLINNLIQLIENDTKLRKIFISYKIDKLNIYGYNYDLIDEICNSEWYRNLGLTTSLKYKVMLKKNTEVIIKEALAHFVSVSK